MTTMTQDRPTVKAGCTCRLHLTIGETTYAVKPLPCDPCLGSKAFRLRKPDGSLYDIIQGEWGPACDCPDMTFRDRPCKHVRALVACGLLDAGHGDAWEPSPEPPPTGADDDEAARRAASFDAREEAHRVSQGDAPAPVEVDALRWAHSISRLWAVATEEQRAAASAVHNCDSGTLGRRIVPPGPSVAELEALASRPADRLIRVESDGADATMRALGFARRGDGWEKRVPAKDRPTGLTDYDARRWVR